MIDKLKSDFYKFLSDNNGFLPVAVRLGFDVIYLIHDEAACSYIFKDDAIINSIFGVRIIPSCEQGIIDWLTEEDLILWEQFQERFNKGGK